MNNGKLLALDTPANIKNKFGVGYKLIVEPSQQASQEQFQKLKSDDLDPLVLSQANQDNHVKEHPESSVKKYVYQFPVAQVHLLRDVLSVLESHKDLLFSANIEMSTLEEAYMNIAQQAEDLL